MGELHNNLGVTPPPPPSYRGTRSSHRYSVLFSCAYTIPIVYIYITVSVVLTPTPPSLRSPVTKNGQETSWDPPQGGEDSAEVPQSRAADAEGQYDGTKDGDALQQSDGFGLNVVTDATEGESAVSVVSTHGSGAPATPAPERISERGESKGLGGISNVKSIGGRSEGGGSGDSDDGSCRDQASKGIVSEWSAEKLREVSKVITHVRDCGMLSCGSGLFWWIILTTVFLGGETNERFAGGRGAGRRDRVPEADSELTMTSKEPDPLKLYPWAAIDCLFTLPATCSTCLPSCNPR